MVLRGDRMSACTDVLLLPLSRFFVCERMQCFFAD